MPCDDYVTADMVIPRTYLPLDVSSGKKSLRIVTVRPSPFNFRTFAKGKRAHAREKRGHVSPLFAKCFIVCK